jgi:hypothetical protein
VLSQFQMITAFGSTYQIRLPQVFLDFLDKMSFVNFDVTSIFALQCSADGANGFYVTFWVSMVAPVVLAGVIVLVGKCTKITGNTQIKLVSASPVCFSWKHCLSRVF